jgi:FkbM family methyltransferase
MTRRRFRKAVRLDKLAPHFGGEFFDSLSLLESVADGSGPYVMIELGAGFGRWPAFAAQLCRGVGRPIGRLVACEAEPKHFRWLRQHLRDNGVDPAYSAVIEAAVSDRRGKTPFYVGAAAEWYGQSNVRNSIGSEPFGLAGWLRRRVGAGRVMERVAMADTVALADIVTDCPPVVDFMHVDIQGSEFDVFRPAMELMTAKVRRVHAGTHSPDTAAAAGRDLDGLLADLFRKLGWANLHRVKPGETRDIFGHAVEFNDGVQS